MSETDYLYRKGERMNIYQWWLKPSFIALISIFKSGRYLNSAFTETSASGCPHSRWRPRMLSRATGRTGCLQHLQKPNAFPSRTEWSRRRTYSISTTASVFLRFPRWGTQQWRLSPERDTANGESKHPFCRVMAGKNTVLLETPGIYVFRLSVKFILIPGRVSCVLSTRGWRGGLRFLCFDFISSANKQLVWLLQPFHYLHWKERRERRGGYLGKKIK